MLKINGLWMPFKDPHMRVKYPEDRPPSLSKALKYVKGNKCAIDGGCHVGRWTIWMVKQFKLVFAIELNSVNAECARRNCPEATVIHACLSNKVGMVGQEPDSKPDSSVYCVSSGSDTPSITIDGLHLDALDFLKLDLQGYDYYALLGATQTIVRHKPIILMEHKHKCYTRYGVEDGYVNGFMKGLGYKQEAKWGPDRLWIPK